MNNESRYRLLLEKYLRGKCNSSEVEELFVFLREDGSDRILLNNMQEEFKNTFETDHGIPKEITNRIWTKLKTNIEPVKVVPIQSPFKKWLKVAAAVVAITLSVGLYNYYNFIETSMESVNIKKGQTYTEIAPGGNKAVLTLADGKQIILENAKSGLLAQEENTTINKEDGGVLVYSSQGSKMVKPQFNTISIPRGGQYQVVLPDGSKVWINSSSSLRFPMAFNGIERNVELSGEAYFEVKKDKNMPFIVTVINKHQTKGIGRNNMRIEVLGTHFNVMAYEDESNAVTTLLEGAVKVSNSLTNVLLKPGQQALFNKTDKISVSTGDTEGAVAWKNGYFKFSNENIRSIMNRISRWYDVDVEYKGKIPEKSLWGTISRFEDVSEVLKTLELTGSIHFKLEGRRLIVME